MTFENLTEKSQSSSLMTRSNSNANNDEFVIHQRNVRANIIFYLYTRNIYKCSSLVRHWNQFISAITVDETRDGLRARRFFRRTSCLGSSPFPFSRREFSGYTKRDGRKRTVGCGRDAEGWSKPHRDKAQRSGRRFLLECAG